MLSTTPVSSRTLQRAEPFRRAITSRTSTSGADAPAVTPTRRLPAIHSRLELVGAVDHVRGHAAFAATSRSRLEFELLGLPTTITTSTCGASNLTASCRFCVA